MRVLKVWSGLVLVTACGGSPAARPDAAVDAAIDAAIDAAVDAPPDAPPPVHVGGWRMDGADAAGSCHAGAIGPGATATVRLFHDEPNRRLGAPLIDESGNLYFTSFLQTTDLVSLTGAGVERWRTSLPGGSSISSLALAPSGDLVAVLASGNFPDTVVQLTTFDAATGARRPGAMLAGGFIEPMKVAPDGRVFVQTLVLGDTANYSLEVHASPTAPARWSRKSGFGAFAIAPAGDAVVSVERNDAGTGYTVFGIDAATGAERWHKDLPSQLLAGPGLAIDRDGAAYVAMASNLREMHVYKFAATGALAWDAQNTEDNPTRIVLGADTLYVTANFSFTLRKSDGMPPPGGAPPCGLPLATDGADHLFSACISGTQVTDALGTVLAEWRGAPQALAIAPDGTVYYWPFTGTRLSQLFRIQ